jgi:hypothetical protein
MKNTIALLLPLIVMVHGCVPYAQVQMDLLEQSRRGVVEVHRSLEQKTELIKSYHAQRRRQLDEAFDADVRQRAELTPQWVIDARRAYAAAIDVLHDASDASARAAEIDRRNLAAIDQALQQAIWLQSLQLRWLKLNRQFETSP